MLTTVGVASDQQNLANSISQMFSYLKILLHRMWLSLKRAGIKNHNLWTSFHMKCKEEALLNVSRWWKCSFVIHVVFLPVKLPVKFGTIWESWYKHSRDCIIHKMNNFHERTHLMKILDRSDICLGCDRKQPWDPHQSIVSANLRFQHVLSLQPFVGRPGRLSP